MSGKASLWSVAVPLTVMLVTTGCATKKYVRNQVNGVNQKVGQLETKTNEHIAYLNHKQDRDMSAVNERMDTTDQKIADVANSANQAQGTASRAMESSESNKTSIAGNTTAIDSLQSNVANALNYQLVDKEDVMFAFNKSTLTPQGKAALNQIVSKAQQMPRSVIELAGFTDRIGTKSYNLALSRRRAEAVQRYLVQQNVPLRNIHIVGLGEEAPPENFALDNASPAGSSDKRERDRLARRVHISLYGAGDISQGTASRSQD
jgi:OOP family OmpA-OmpF porin